MNPRATNAVHEEGSRYAPMLALRNVLPSPLPPTTGGSRVAAGREVGRSFRDRMRSGPRPGRDVAVRRAVASRRELAPGARVRARRPRRPATRTRAGSGPPRFRLARAQRLWPCTSACRRPSPARSGKPSARRQRISSAKSFRAFEGDPAAAAHAEDAQDGWCSPLEARSAARSRLVIRPGSRRHNGSRRASAAMSTTARART